MIEKSRAAATASELMRSRYTAFAIGAIGWLGDSLHPEHRADWDRPATEKWAAQSEWLGLEVGDLEAGGEDDDSGWVEFVATYKEGGAVKRHAERGYFERHAGLWYYVRGEAVKPQTRRNVAKIGRNDPCPCGSGKKYKKCCGAAA